MEAFFGLSTILPLVGLLVGAGLQYIFNKTLESRKQLTLQKGPAYADYFRSMSASATQGQSKETLTLAIDAKTRICIYGSPDVIRRLGDFERVGATVSPGEGQATVAALLRAMRQDMGVAARETIDSDDLNHALFGPHNRR